MNTVNTEFFLLRFGLQIRLIKHLKLKIMSRFTDQTNKALEIEDNVNLTLIIG